VSAATAATGAGAGKPTFSPLTVDLDPGSDIAALFKDVATGQHIKSVELQGVSSDGATVYDLKLGDVFITTVHDTSTGLDSLQLSYGQISLTTTPENPDGSLGTPVTSSWNLITNAQDVAIPDPVVPAGTAASGGGAHSYFLTIDGIIGGSTVAGHEGAFGIADYSFDINSLVNAATAATGAGAGKPTFSPLTVDLDPGSDIAALLKDVATGQHIKSVELQGVSTNGATVTDLKLGDVFITTVHDTSTGLDSLRLSYGQISLTTATQNPDGSPGTPITSSWNLITNTQDVHIADPNVNSAPVITSGADFSVAENTTAVGSVTAVDLEHDAFTFSLTGGADASFFVIDAGTGALKFAASPDFETPADANHDNVYDVIVSATDSHGATSMQDINVHVTDVVEIGKTINGGNGNDALTGTTGDDIISGGNGNDQINGGDGNDNISGGSGNDVLIGGRGNNTLDGGDGNDTLTAADGNNIMNGGNGNDTITAGNGNNTINGGDGNDTVTVGNGNNTIVGGNGNETVTAGNGNNSFAGGNGNDTIVVGNGNNTINSGDGNDTITVGNGNNVLNGGNGNDTFHVGAGSNTLTGSSGNDTFVFAANFGKDVVTDFSHGDIVEFDGVFKNFQAVQAASHQVGADTVIALDAQHSVTLQHVTLSSLHASDFHLV
jgi:Ca2+-binding RTX toxin-like protein